LRQAIRAAGAKHVLSFTDRMNVLTLLACFGGPWDVIIAERSNPQRQWLGRVWEFLRRRTYPRCRAIVVQTEYVARYARSLVGTRPVYVIPNGVRPPATVRAPRSRERLIVAIGRLSREKGFDLLLRAFAQVASSHPDWSLQILGEGDERRALESLVHSLQLGDRVRLPGWVNEPEPILQHAAIFVLSSRYEGFPNALLEAMAAGLACISFACDSGPAEIVRHEVDGLLVPAEDVDALAHALDRLVTDEATRVRLAEAATDVVGRFSYDAFFDRWDKVLT
jgi:glycosyltransferase involved in cell wall biosynthesis